MAYTTSSFESDLEQLPERNKSSIYSLLLAKIGKIKAQSYIEHHAIKELVVQIRKFMLNHEQDLSKVKVSIKKTLLTKQLSSALKNLLADALIALSNDGFCQSYCVETITSEDLTARIPRLLESNLAISLLHSPSDGMWASVDEISETIITILEDNKKNTQLFCDFIQGVNGKLGNENEPNLLMAFGHFNCPKNLEDIIETLKESNDLAVVMLIHFMFMRNAFPLIQFSREFYWPIIDNYAAGEFGAYINLLNLPNDYDSIGSFFCNYTAIAQSLYTDRGRGPFHEVLNDCLGIVINENDRQSMPRYVSAWYPDCLCQAADLESPYVNFLVKNDIPYVAGPSGMTSLFSGALSLLGNFKEEQAKNYYLLAVMAYMISGGLHSIHEVLSVPKIRLGLLPDYRVSGKSPANYDAFFSLFAADAQVVNAINDAWKNTIEWLNQTYPEATCLKHIVGKPDDENTRNCIIL
jgi:hypothetical protein